MVHWNTEDGDEKLITPTTDANASDKIGMKDIRLLTKISSTDGINQRYDGLDAPAKDNFKSQI